MPFEDDANDPSADNIDDVLSSPPGKQQCMCGNTFAELGEAAMKRLQTVEVEEGEALARMTSVGSGSGLGSVERWGSMSAMEKEEEEEEGRRNSSSCDRPRGSS